MTLVPAKRFSFCLCVRVVTFIFIFHFIVTVIVSFHRAVLFFADQRLQCRLNADRVQGDCSLHLEPKTGELELLLLLLVVRGSGLLTSSARRRFVIPQVSCPLMLKVGMSSKPSCLPGRLQLRLWVPKLELVQFMVDSTKGNTLTALYGKIVPASHLKQHLCKRRLKEKSGRRHHSVSLAIDPMGFEVSEELNAGLQDWMCLRNGLAALTGLRDDDRTVSTICKSDIFVPLCVGVKSSGCSMLELLRERV